MHMIMIRNMHLSGGAMDDREQCPHGEGWCELVDKPCLLDMGMECDTYNEIVEDSDE